MKKRKPYKKWLYSVLAGLALGYIAACIMLYTMQTRFVYHPPTYDWGNCAGLPSSQAILIGGTHAYYTKRGAKLAISYHGNGATACGEAWVDDYFEENNISTLYVEYPGYTTDDGNPTKERVLDTVDEVAKWQQEQHAQKVMLLGESLGTGAAAYHATKIKVEHILLISAYDSTELVAKDLQPLFPVSLLLTEKYTTLEWLKEQNASITEIHGKDDWKIKPERSEAIGALPNAKRYLVPGGHVEDIVGRPEFDALVKKDIEEFSNS